jgi:dTDP-4-amino-4,6-dideoxygalactose transaminase
MSNPPRQLAIFGGRPVKRGRWPQWPLAPDGALKSLARILNSERWTVSSRYTGEPSQASIFADKFAAFNKVAYCVPCCSGTAGLVIALEALGIGQGDEVLVPGLTWVACATAVLQVGARPILVDIDLQTLCISPGEAEAALTSRTKAIILVHAYCSIADIARFQRLAAAHNLFLIEDCSQAHGALYEGIPVGGFGHASTFSMQQSKLLTSGEGGAVLTNSPEVFTKLDQLRADGRKTFVNPQKGEFQLKHGGSIQGYNYCLSEFHAAILVCQLEHLPRQNQIRARNAEYLNDLLEDLKFAESIYRPNRSAAPTIYRFCIRLRRELWREVDCRLIADALAIELNLPIELLHLPLNSNPLYSPSLSRRLSPQVVEACEPAGFHLPNAHQAWTSCICIPHHAFLASEKEMEQISLALKKLWLNLANLTGHHRERE